jgi:predicted RNase H-like HicB family nuclease
LTRNQQFAGRTLPNYTCLHGSTFDLILGTDYLMKKPLVVHAVWDEEAHVWVATSDDVPGLATEAATSEELVQKLKAMIPELLSENGYPDSDEDIPFQLQSQMAGVVHRSTSPLIPRDRKGPPKAGVFFWIGCPLPTGLPMRV